MGQNVTICRVVRFNDSISRIFGQVGDGNALTMGQLNGVATGNRTIGCTTATNKGIGVGSIFKSYGEREEFSGVATIAGNCFTDCQTANFTGIREGSNLGLSCNNRSSISGIFQFVAICRVIGFNDSISRIFGQIVDSNALTMSQLNGVTTGNRAVSCSARTNIRVGIGSIFKSYSE